ncbi:ROK family protein [Microbacterium sp. ARD32]|uniref:ROK family protein n=1 Tax=Microbacterium sp. ARD32 TaxID=2962577 RepID=UPI0028827607|nr:ROK family protein [Microbacterium sp. ARD32]MDT0156496.1 ROK family protein [Microbacterium sp. ARD32]
MTAAGVRIGLDVGGTKTAGIALDEYGATRATVRIGTEWGADGVIAGVLEAVMALRAELPPLTAVESIGIGIPGLVDAESGRVLHAVNLGVQSLDVADRVALATGAPCFVENDVKAAALGAASLRESREPLAYLNLGTGVAAGLIVEGRIWRGARGTAGEIGHLVVDPAGRVCGCGQRGCIETLCGGGALARAWGADAEFPVTDMLDAADAGDAAASALREDLFRGVAAAVRALVLAADVETVVIGGGLSALADRIVPGIRARQQEEAASSAFLRSLRLDERIEMLPADSPVAAIGAALLGSAPAETVARHEEITHG